MRDSAYRHERVRVPSRDGQGPPPAAVPSAQPSAGESSAEPQRELADEALLRRIAVEYEEMPCLRLTFAQAQRLFGLRQEACIAVLDTLVARGVLRRDAQGMYVRNGGSP